jgi:hypothetical protein
MRAGSTTTRAAGSRFGGRKSQERVVIGAEHLFLFSHEAGLMSRPESKINCEGSGNIQLLRLTGSLPPGIMGKRSLDEARSPNPHLLLSCRSIGS